MKRFSPGIIPRSVTCYTIVPYIYIGRKKFIRGLSRVSGTGLGVNKHLDVILRFIMEFPYKFGQRLGRVARHETPGANQGMVIKIFTMIYLKRFSPGSNPRIL